MVCILNFLNKIFEFFFGIFIVCLKTLQKLLESCPDDPKVLFNLALTEYALSSFQKTDIFKNQLNKIAEKVISLFETQNTKLDFVYLASLSIR